MSNIKNHSIYYFNYYSSIYHQCHIDICKFIAFLRIKDNKNKKVIEKKCKSKKKKINNNLFYNLEKQLIIFYF